MQISSLNGSVQSQGLKLTIDDWLDMGSEGWKNTSDQVKAAAYQAARVCGWTDQGIKAVILKAYAPRIDEEMAEYIIDLLKEISKQYPVEVTKS